MQSRPWPWFVGLIVLAIAGLPSPGQEANGLSVRPEARFSGEAPEPDQAEEPEEPPENPFEDAIETDRDSFTPSTRTVGCGRLVLESAYSFVDNRGVAETHSFPELLLRVGVSRRLELRLGWNYEVGGAGSDVSNGSGDDDELASGGRVEKEHRVSYGFKAALTEQAGLLPDSIVIVQGFTPTGGESTDSQVAATYAVGWELPLRWKTDAAIRYGTASEREDHFGVWAPSAVLKIPVGDRVNIHGEYFGLFSHGKAENYAKHYLSPGFHVLLTPDVEVGVRVGWGLNDQASRFFSNVGLGLRF